MTDTKLFSIKNRGGGETIMVHKDHVDEFEKPPFELIAPFLLRCTRCAAEIESGIVNVSEHYWECHARKLDFSVGAT